MGGRLLYDAALISMCGCAVSIMSLEDLVGILVKRSNQSLTMARSPILDLINEIHPVA